MPLPPFSPSQINSAVTQWVKKDDFVFLSSIFIIFTSVELRS